MKKYILTNDYKIYKVAKEAPYHYHCRINKRERIYIPKRHVIKERCKVDELCDKFVLAGIDVIILNEEHTRYRFEGEDEWFDITQIELKRGIYGAIWTDKCLLYVAKMNKKGKFKSL